MIFTRRFGALRARPVHPSVRKEDEQLRHDGDVRLLDHREDTDKKAGESAA